MLFILSIHLSIYLSHLISSHLILSHLSVYILKRIYKYLSAYIYICVNVYIYIYVCICIYIYICICIYIYIILETRDKPWRYCGGIVYDVAAVDPINSTHSSVIDQLLWRVGIQGSRQTKRIVTNEEGKRVLFLIMPASLISS